MDVIAGTIWGLAVLAWLISLPAVPLAGCLKLLAIRGSPRQLTLGTALLWVAASAVILATLALTYRVPGVLWPRWRPLCLLAVWCLYALPMAFLACYVPRRPATWLAWLWPIVFLVALMLVDFQALVERRNVLF